MNRLATRPSIRQRRATMKNIIATTAIALTLIGCAVSTPAPTRTAHLSSTRALPPAPKAPPRLPGKRMAYNPNPAANVIQKLDKPFPSFGYSRRTHITNYATANTLVGIRPAAAGSLTEHGPVYSITNYAPYPLVYVGADYQLKAGKTYFFEITEDFIHWYETGNYLAQEDEVYARFVNESVNGYHTPHTFQRVRGVP